jgi:microcystin-dependent protein
MSVAAFVQPNNTSQNSTVYLGSIDGDMAVLAILGQDFAPHQQGSPNMTVAVDPGAFELGNSLVTQAAQNSVTITAPNTNPRIDRIVIQLRPDVAGQILYVAGVQGVSPSPPAIPDGCAPLCQISLATSTTAITNSLLTDERVWIGNAQTQVLPVAKSVDYTSVSTDQGASFSYSSAALRTHTLPASTTISAGWWQTIISTATSGVKLLCQGTDVLIEGAGSPGAYYFAEGLAKITYIGGGLFNVEGVEQSGGYKDYPTNTVPRGYLRRDGSLISRTTYAALFGRIGTTWGVGDGSTTFGIPDDRGSVQIGDGQGAGLTNRTVAQTGGEEAHANVAAENGPHAHTSPSGGTLAAGAQAAQSSTSTGSITTSTSGSGTPHNNMQPFTVCLKAIKY